LSSLPTKDSEKKKTRNFLSKSSTAKSEDSRWNWTGLKKNVGISAREKTLLIEREDNIIPAIRQAELLGIARSTVYYEPIVDASSLELMRLFDQV